MDDPPGSPEAGNPRDSDHGSAANISKQLRLHIILFWSDGNICGARQYDIHPLHKFHLKMMNPVEKRRFRTWKETMIFRGELFFFQGRVSNHYANDHLLLCVKFFKHFFLNRVASSSM